MLAHPTSRRHATALACLSLAVLCATALAQDPPDKTTKDAIEAKVAVIRKAKEPTTLKELNEWYPAVPERDNAALVYVKAFAKLGDAAPVGHVPLVGEVQLPPRGQPLADHTKLDIATYLAGKQEGLALLHQGAALKEARYPVDLTAGFATQLPHLAQMRQATRVLALEAVLAADEQKPDQAVKSVLTGLALAKSIEREPLLISRLVQIACNDVTFKALERVLSRWPLTAEQLQTLAAAVLQNEDVNVVRRAVVGERCSGHDVFSRKNVDELNAVMEEEPGWNKTVGVRGLVLLGYWDKDHLYYLNLMGDVIEILKSPPPERLDLMNDLNMGQQVRQLPKYCVLSRMILPALERMVEADANGIARLRAARAAVAVEQFRVATGALPKSLDELVPKYLDKMIADPFDGKPLRYKPLPKGYVVYSIGENLADDGGKEKKGQEFDFDVTVTVER